MTAYVAELVLAIFAVIGTGLVVYEEWRRRSWVMVLFFLLFGLAPAWFSVASFIAVATGEAGWLLYRWAAFWIRVPLVLCLYVVYGWLRAKNAR